MIRLKSEPRAVASGAVLAVAVLALFALAIVRWTGGGRSEYIPLLYLPVVCAVLLRDMRAVLFIGLFTTAGYFGLVHPLPHHTASFGDLTRLVALNLIALLGALGVQRAERDREKMQRQVEEQEALLNASQIINAADKLDHAVSSALLLVTRLVPRCRCAAILMPDESERALDVCDVIGVERSDLAFEHINLDEVAPNWRPNDARPLILDEPAELSRAPIGRLDPFARSVVCVAIRASHAAGTPVGLLYVSAPRSRAFSASQVQLLGAFADRIGLPMERIRVQEGLRGLAFTDGMTGLYNFRSFRKHLGDEMHRSSRYRRPLSLIILDLDDFKSINDRFGHPAGDRLLMEVADTLRHTVRETDVPARYGGEEFVVICPETLGDDAAVVAERIRAAVTGSTFHLGEGIEATVSISAGVATFPTDALDESSLIHAADGALYHAKRSGKNRVVTANGVTPAAS